MKCCQMQKSSSKSFEIKTLPLQSPVQFLTLDGVFMVKLGVRWMHASVSQTAVGRVVLWQAQQRAPHKHPATRTRTLGSSYHT